MLATIQLIGILCGGLVGSSKSECLHYYINCTWPEDNIFHFNTEVKLLKCARVRLNEEAQLQEERWEKSFGN